MRIGFKIGVDIGSKLGTSPYGIELITNGDFSNGLTGWTDGTGVDANLSVVNGELNYEQLNTNYTSISQGGILEVGKTYRLLINIVSNPYVNAFRIGLAGVNYVITSSGIIDYEFTATSGTTFAIVRNSISATPALLIVDNISIREVL